MTPQTPAPKNFRPAVFCVVYTFNSDGQVKYLVLNRKKHWTGWEFPKGGIDKGETELETVKREVKEETGLKAIKINSHNFSGKYLYKNVFKDRPGFIGQTFNLYSALVRKGKVNYDKREHKGYKWLSFEEALKIITKRNQKKSLEIVNNLIGSTH